MKYCSYNGRHSLRASYNVLKNHPDYGVNATPTVCYICKKPMFYTPFFNTMNRDCSKEINTINGVVCPECKAKLEIATLFIKTFEEEDTIRFGSYIFINDNALENYFDNVEALDKINYMHPKDFDFLRNDIDLDLTRF